MANMSENFSGGSGNGGGGGGGGASSNQACAACKHQRRKCTENCLLAPYFPPEQARRFQAVHKFFGVCNVLKILKSLNTHAEKQRAVESLCWEAECRERYPVDGCLGALNELKLDFGKEREQLQAEIQMAKRQIELYAIPYLQYGVNHQHRHSIQSSQINNPALYIPYSMSQTPPHYYHATTALQQGGASLSVGELLGVDNNGGGGQQRTDVMAPQNLVYSSMMSGDSQQQKPKTEPPST